MIETESVLDTTKMAYPFGRCAGCGKEFDSDLRNEYKITCCPWCGQLILDYFHDTNPPPGLSEKPDTNNYYYCEDCGTRIYERSGKGGHWLNEGETGPGVCSGPCERELCGKCGDWDDEGCCPICSLPCDVCPKEGCEKHIEVCKNPCANCSMKNDCLNGNTDKRNECQAFTKFLEGEDPCEHCATACNFNRARNVTGRT